MRGIASLSAHGGGSIGRRRGGQGAAGRSGLPGHLESAGRRGGGRGVPRDDAAGLADARFCRDEGAQAIVVQWFTITASAA